MSSTTLKKLNEIHERDMFSNIRNEINNVFSYHYVSASMINDIPWMYEDPQFEKQHGRAHRVYEKLNTLRNFRK